MFPFDDVIVRQKHMEGGLPTLPVAGHLNIWDTSIVDDDDDDDDDDGDDDDDDDNDDAAYYAVDAAADAKRALGWTELLFETWK